MPNLEKYLSSRFAFSTNQTDNICKYCEKFIPKSISQHYRYCFAKKEFNFKNGIVNDTNLSEEINDYEPNDNQLKLNETVIIQNNTSVQLPTNITTKEKQTKKSKK